MPNEDWEEQCECALKGWGASMLSCVQLFVTPMDAKSTRLFCPWNSPGKNTGVGCHFLLQGIFPTQESNLHLFYQQAYSLILGHLGSPVRVYSPGVK